jgi:hypothetical protein
MTLYSNMKHVILMFGVFFCVIFLLNSCDNFNNIDGLVIDDKTYDPIDSVPVYVNINGEISDSFSSILDSLTKTDRQDYIKK